MVLPPSIKQNSHKLQTKVVPSTQWRTVGTTFHSLAINNKVWKLLPHQYKLLEYALQEEPTDATEVLPWAIALISGFAGGKSEAVHRALVIILLQFPGVNVAIYAPTLDLLKLNNQPRIAELLDDLGVEYTYNKQDFIFDVKDYGKIICRSMDNPSRIIAYEVFLSVVDELDTLPEVKAREAWNKIIARNRQTLPGVTLPNKVLVATTPESFSFVYKTWKKDPQPGYVMIKARTEDNPFIPPSYVENLRASYPPQLIEAYLEGEFVNLTGGRVYHVFDRFTHNFNSADLLTDLSSADNVISL